MRIHAVIRTVLLAAIISGCAAPAKSPQAGTGDEDAIRRMATEYTQAIGNGDREKFVSFFTDSIVIMPPGAATMRGREAARGFAGPLFDNFNVQEVINYDELHLDGDWATGRFSYTMTLTPKAGGTPTTERGKAIAWLRRGPSGAWQFSHWIWNQDGSK